MALTKWRIIALVTSKSAITPSFMGRIVRMESGVRPYISLAFFPTSENTSSIIRVQGDDRGFIKNDSSIFCVNQSIRCPLSPSRYWAPSKI